MKNDPVTPAKVVAFILRSCADDITTIARMISDAGRAEEDVVIVRQVADPDHMCADIGVKGRALTERHLEACFVRQDHLNLVLALLREPQKGVAVIVVADGDGTDAIPSACGYIVWSEGWCPPDHRAAIVVPHDADRSVN
jgi:hypothetical protein